MVLYEIEQKFCFNPILLSKFRSNGGHPPFRRVEFVQNQVFEDAYFDQGNKLSKQGIWIRRRGSFWEAKARQSGDYLRTSFHETNDINEISTLIKSHIPSKADVGPENNFALDMICRYRTLRDTFHVDDKFDVMLDATDFGHCVGEVELMMDNEERAHSDIDTFMKRYSWFFLQGGKPKGKMTAYFERFGFPQPT
jgi:thiamine-triphosphatase